MILYHGTHQRKSQPQDTNWRAGRPEYRGSEMTVSIRVAGRQALLAYVESITEHNEHDFSVLTQADGRYLLLVQQKQDTIRR